MRLNAGALRQIISEVVDDVVEDAPEKDELSLVSVDDQIDAILVGFEAGSMSERGLQEFASLSLLDLVLEQEADDDEDFEEPDPEKQVTSRAARTEEDPVDPDQPALDVDEFVIKVGRLILNYDNLIDIPSVIVNRAKNYLLSNGYSDEIVESFQDELFNQFGPDLGLDFEGPKVPPAAGAGPIGGTA